MDSPRLPETPRALRKPKELPLNSDDSLPLDLPHELGPLELPSANTLLNFSNDGGLSPLTEKPLLIQSEAAEYTPSQLFDLNQKLLNESVQQRPLIDKITHISELREEYEGGSASFVKQIDWLQEKGFNYIRRTKGDGDCFYRSLAFAYVESIMSSSDQGLAVGTSLSKLSSTTDMLDKIGNERAAYEMFLEALTDLVEDIANPDPTKRLTSEGLLRYFQDVNISNSIVMYLRLVTSSEILLNHAEYEGFIAETNMRVEEYCNAVQILGRDADHVEIQALSRALELNIDVAYLTGSENGPVNVNFIEFRPAPDVVTPPLVLLYRPGHYDILPVKSKA